MGLIASGRRFQNIKTRSQYSFPALSRSAIPLNTSHGWQSHTAPGIRLARFKGDGFDAAGDGRMDKPLAGFPYFSANSSSTKVSSPLASFNRVAEW